MVELIITLFVLAGAWRMFQKMGRQGWEAIIPFYNTYVVCQELYGQGWKLLLFLIPLYNIYFLFKMNIDLAKAFNQNAGYGIGLALLSVVFVPLTGFGSAVYRDGSRRTYAADPISRTLDEVSDRMNGGSQQAQQRQQEQEVLRMLRELESLHAAGVLTDEEFAAKKAELLRKL